LSIQSVDKAIYLESLTPSNGAFCDDSNCPILWAQSELATNPNATLEFSPSSINFGDVPVATPEPPLWMLALAALVVVSWCRTLKRRTPSTL